MLYVCIYRCTYVRTYVDVPVASVYISATYTPKTSPLTPFVVVYRCSLFSRCCFLFFSFFLPASHPPSARLSTYLPVSRILDGKTRDRVGNNVPGKKLRKEENFLERSFSLVLSPALFLFSPFPPLSLSPPPSFSLAHIEFRRSTLHVFAGKRTHRGELSCRIQRGDRRKRERVTEKGDSEEKEGQRGRERNDNPFGGHNAEPGTVKLTRQEIRPTNRPLSLCFSVFLRLLPWSLSRSPFVSSSLLYPAANLPSVICKPPSFPHPSRPVINLLNYITRTRYPLCPPRLYFSLCFRDALHSSISILLSRLFSFSVSPSFFFSYKSHRTSRNRANSVL